MECWGFEQQNLMQITLFVFFCLLVLVEPCTYSCVASWHLHTSTCTQSWWAWTLWVRWLWTLLPDKSLVVISSSYQETLQICCHLYQVDQVLTEPMLSLPKGNGLQFWWVWTHNSSIAVFLRITHLEQELDDYHDLGCITQSVIQSLYWRNKCHLFTCRCKFRA